MTAWFRARVAPRRGLHAQHSRRTDAQHDTSGSLLLGAGQTNALISRDQKQHQGGEYHRAYFNEPDRIAHTFQDDVHRHILLTDTLSITRTPLRAGPVGFPLPLPFQPLPTLLLPSPPSDTPLKNKNVERAYPGHAVGSLDVLVLTM
ncbi:hypothetical protein [Reticulibacter mediterranei]|uniref:hypothetical protein n=1 Tax=Reticulibacter mediterranei TaxID=2778369 RepID=UPI001C68DE2E|nr:hypothetical protein [Reticulibacter mediterranei]